MFSRLKGLASINNKGKKKNNQIEITTNYGSWSIQRPRRRGDQSRRECLQDDTYQFYNTLGRLRGCFTPYPQRWVICVGGENI